MHQYAKYLVDHLKNRCGDMAVFRFFSKCRPFAILYFSEFEILPAGPLRKANVRLRGKFRADRSNVCGDMANFRFFKMAAVCHLGFVLRVFGPHTKSI